MIDLFCGIGGFHMGFKGHAEVVFASDIDKFARQTYETNHDLEPRGDITKIKSEDIPDADILTGGFPCQSFSSIGKRAGFDDDEKGALFFEIIRISKAKKPKMMLLENVKGLLTHDGGATLARVLQELNDIGYNVFYKLINSADFGVPQSRERVYFVCFRNDIPRNEFEFPKGSGRVGIGEFIEDDPQGYSISKHLQDNYLFKKNDGRPRIVDKNTTNPSNTLVTSYHKIQRLTGTFVRGGSTGIRLFSQAECLAQQGFPEDFIIPVSRTQMYRQLGNSVSVPVVKAIADTMVSALNVERPTKRARLIE